MRLSKYFLFFFVVLFLHKIAEKDFVMLCLLWIKKLIFLILIKLSEKKVSKIYLGFAKKKERIETKSLISGCFIFSQKKGSRRGLKIIFLLLFFSQKKDQEDV